MFDFSKKIAVTTILLIAFMQLTFAQAKKNTTTPKKTTSTVKKTPVATKKALSSKTSNANNRELLEKQRNNLLQEIQQTETLLNQLKKDKTVTLDELSILQKKLSSRQKLINNINKQVQYVDYNIEQTKFQIYDLREEMSVLKKQYAEMVRYSYKNKTSYDMIIFMFSANSFNDAIRRMQYVKQYRNFQADQATKIVGTSKKLISTIDVLNKDKAIKAKALNDQKSQNAIIEKETAEKNKMVLALKGKEKELLIQINNKKKIAASLNTAISNTIAREIELARKRAIDEQLTKNAEQKAKEALARKLAIEKKKIEDQKLALARLKETELDKQRQQAAEKLKKEALEKKLAIEKKLQDEQERKLIAEQKAQKDREEKLALERKKQDEQEKLLAQQRLEREEAERKAAAMAQKEREERQLQLAIEKRKQEEREKQLALERKKQEELAAKLLTEKKEQEFREKLLANKRRIQEEEKKAREQNERERQSNANRDMKFNNPRFVQVDDNKSKKMYGDVALNNSESIGPSLPKKENIKEDYSNLLTPSEKALSNNFEANQGRLPWPVNNGFICERFGKNKHPVFNVYTENPGIDIKVSKGSVARAIFAGEVSSVISMPGAGQTVIVNHGSYFSVYSKLEGVSVSRGSKISMKQPIGRVMTDASGQCQIGFQIWKVNSNGAGAIKINPEYWVIKS